jgi:hypothetical protein
VTFRVNLKTKSRLRITAPAAIIIRLGDSPILTLIAALLIQIVAPQTAFVGLEGPARNVSSPSQGETLRSMKSRTAIE